MALINNYYVFVEKEEFQRDVSITEHPVETGMKITDNVRKEPRVIRLTGEIVQNGDMDAASITKNIESLSRKGTLVKYMGRCTLDNAIIASFNTSYTNTIDGGCAFTAEIREIRIAKSAYTAKSKSSGTKQVTEKKKKKTRYYTVKRGDCLWNIAKSYYGNGASYTKIYKANKSKIKNPNIIQIGMKLIIPY